jgi:hypothetical protein
MFVAADSFGIGRIVRMAVQKLGGRHESKCRKKVV